MDPRITPIDEERRWLTPGIGLAIIFLLYLIFQSLLNPIGATASNTGQWLGLALVGVVITQPLLFGMWAALAPGRFILRGPLTLAAMILTNLGGAMLPWNLWQPDEINPLFELEIIAWEIGFFLIAMLILLAFRRFAGWRIVLKNDPSCLTPTNQFSLKFLLGLTTGCAILLGLGRVFEASYGSIAITAAVVLLTFFPIFVVPLTAISTQISFWVLALLFLVWIVLGWLAVEVMAAQDNSARAATVIDVLLLQFGAIIASLSSAAILRFAGFRFVQPTRSAINNSDNL